MRLRRGRRTEQRGVAPDPRRPGVLLLAILALTAGLAGCASVEPWVKPYEREHLADPIMALSRNTIAATYRDHVFETREGSHGATGAVGGGCGCN
jgi:hypothetical protein